MADTLNGAPVIQAGQIDFIVYKFATTLTGGSKEQQVKGLGKQISGKAEKKLGDAKETIKKGKK